MTHTGEIESILDQLEQKEETNPQFNRGLILYKSGRVQVLAQSKDFFEIAVEDNFDDFHISFKLDEKIAGDCSCKAVNWCSHRVAAILEVKDILESAHLSGNKEGKEYTREGMIKRVLDERRDRARKAKYRMRWADNVFGEHTLYNEKDVTYRITFRDIERESGYCSCSDYATNKLATCKHLVFAFDAFKKKRNKKKTEQAYPFIEVYLDPLNDYRVSWFYPHTIDGEMAKLLNSAFKKKTFIDTGDEHKLLPLLKEARLRKQILIRPEVLAKVEAAFEARILQQKEKHATLDFSAINATLYPYQEEGMRFATFRKGAIIADEMGLGKTIQAIGAAIFKKQVFGFSKTLVICPASLKAQWKSEIEKFTNEKAALVEGFPEERFGVYKKSDAYFLIINYETVLRDMIELNKYGFDLVILDEAQRIKNFETITANAIKSLKRNHSLVITGTPIENKLVDIYSIAGFTAPELLSPLWEFSYQHCFFDKGNGNKITGYHHLQELKEKLKPVLIRREKKDVIKQLNNITMVDVAVNMHPIQADYHAAAAKAIASILHKKFKTPYDMQMLTMHLQSMRMACDSSFLVDKETHHSPKMSELEEIILQKLDLPNNQRKIIIFSEWTTMNQIIGRMLAKNGIGFTELNGKIPVKNRKKIISEFEKNPDCQVFLSTEAGGAGLNLQVADTVINFELPWNPAKKNQRIGRIDRLGQKHKNLTVINLITRHSIEMKIASGLVVKQNLFDSVLNADGYLDEVDFSEKGRSQFLQQLEMAMAEFTQADATTNDESMMAEVVKEAQAVQQELFAEETPAAGPAQPSVSEEQIKKLEEMETVMNKGMEFLSGLFKMSTGKDLSANGNRVEIDRNTGEVVMRFKLEF